MAENKIEAFAALFGKKLNDPFILIGLDGSKTVFMFTPRGAEHQIVDEYTGKLRWSVFNDVIPYLLLGRMRIEEKVEQGALF